MLADPDARGAEAFRILATNIDFVNLDHGARSIMITSAARARASRQQRPTSPSHWLGRVVEWSSSTSTCSLPSLRVLRPPKQAGPDTRDAWRLQLDDALVPIPVVDSERSSPSGNGTIGGVLKAFHRCSPRTPRSSLAPKHWRDPPSAPGARGRRHRRCTTAPRIERRSRTNSAVRRGAARHEIVRSTASRPERDCTDTRGRRPS